RRLTLSRRPLRGPLGLGRGLLRGPLGFQGGLLGPGLGRFLLRGRGVGGDGRLGRRVLLSPGLLRPGGQGGPLRLPLRLPRPPPSWACRAACPAASSSAALRRLASTAFCRSCSAAASLAASRAAAFSAAAFSAAAAFRWTPRHSSTTAALLSPSLQALA